MCVHFSKNKYLLFYASTSSGSKSGGIKYLKRHEIWRRLTGWKVGIQLLAQWIIKQLWIAVGKTHFTKSCGQLAGTFARSRRGIEGINWFKGARREEESRKNVSAFKKSMKLCEMNNGYW